MTGRRSVILVRLAGPIETCYFTEYSDDTARDAVGCNRQMRSKISAQGRVDNCLKLWHTSATRVDIRYAQIPPTARRNDMTISPQTDREMLTAEEVHDMTGVPISTLHDWAAKRERGIDAPGPHHIRLSDRRRR